MRLLQAFGGLFGKLAKDFYIIEQSLDFVEVINESFDFGSLSQKLLSLNLVIPEFGLSAQMIKFSESLRFGCDVKDTSSGRRVDLGVSRLMQLGLG